jgi:REP element-mobilizing transposase RayT
MPQSLARILVHTVFSAKDRRPWLRDLTLRHELHHYLGGILKHLRCQPVIVGGVEDHVHLLASFSRTCTAAEVVKELKRGSSLWARSGIPACGTLAGKRLWNVLHWRVAN